MVFSGWWSFVVGRVGVVDVLAAGSSGGCARGVVIVSVSWSSEASGGRSCEAADALQRFDEVVEERVAGREAQDEAAAGAADGGGDSDEAEAEPFHVAAALLLGQGEQFQPGEQVEGEQRAEQVGLAWKLWQGRLSRPRPSFASLIWFSRLALARCQTTNWPVVCARPSRISV